MRTATSPRTGSRLGLAAGALLVAGALTACSSTVNNDEVTQQVDDAVAEAAGAAPESTDCPDELTAEEGATTTCTVTVDGTDYDVDVEVTTIEGDTANFDVAVPEELQAAPGVPADAVAEQVAAQLTEEVGEAPDDVTCPEDLPAEVGASITCLLTAGGDEYDTEVTATAVEGDNVNFDIEVAPEPNS